MKRLSLFLLFILTSSAFAQADWTLYTHMAADNDLSAYASMDLVEEMAKATLSKRVNVVAQCDLPNHQGGYRFKIENNKVVTVGVLKVEMGKNHARDLVSGVRWAKNNYPAKHYAISLWGHGSGVIDPIRSLMRGILYDDTNGTYLNNQGMLAALNKIKNDILGKKIDVLGMDSCLMADLEVGYQIKDCVNYFVASQQTEPAFGWDYCGFLSEASKKNLTPFEFASSIVKSYKHFYDQKQVTDYTQSAVDLTKIGLVEENLNLIIDKWNKCENALGVEFKNIIKDVRQKSLEFEDDDFIDLHFFCKTILDELEQIKLSGSLAQAKPGVVNSNFVNTANIMPSHNFKPKPKADSSSQKPRVSLNPANMPHSGDRPNIFVKPSALSQSEAEVEVLDDPRPSQPQPVVELHPTKPKDDVKPYDGSKPTRPKPDSSSRPSFNLRPTVYVRSLDFTHLNLTSNQVKNLTNDLQELKDLLNEEMLLIEQIVISNVVGSEINDAKGISIYFPKNNIHSSYYLTNFANDGNWVSFLNKFI